MAFPKGTPLHCEVQGQGRAVILLHSGLVDSRSLKELADGLATKFKTFRCDQRGAGKSPEPTGEFSHVEDLKELLDSSGIQQAVLVGHSLGGRIAIDFAVSYPSRVSKMVLIAPGLSGFNWSKEYTDWGGALWTDSVPKKVFDRLLTSALYRGVRKSEKPLRRFREEALFNIERVVKRDKDTLQWPKKKGIDFLSQIQTPVLILTGEQDHPELMKISQLIKKKVPSSKLKVLEGVDHLSNYTSSERLTKEIFSFLR